MRSALLATFLLGARISLSGGAAPERQLVSSANEPEPRAAAIIRGSMAGSLSAPPLSVFELDAHLLQTSRAIRELKEQLRLARASGVLLDWSTGRVLAEEGEQHAAAPGSLLKPFLLAYALQHAIVNESTQVYCRRTLRVAGRSLPCSHPNDLPMLNAEGALAESCNTWFASLARRMAPGDMQAALAQAGLPPTVHHLDDSDMRVLVALGLENVKATPMQIAKAYRALLLNEPHSSAAWNGLRRSVTYGMASNARVAGVDVLGKTGTAKDPDQWWTHGWFAGGVPGRFVLVIYVPRGDGGTAASMAGAALKRLASGGTR